MRQQFTSARLERVGWDGGSPFSGDGTRAHAVGTIECGTARFRSRLKGTYILTLAAKTERGWISGLLPQELDLDNTDGDQDLGVVSIPGDPGSVRFRVTADTSRGVPPYVTMSLFPQEGPGRPVQATLSGREETLHLDLVPAGITVTGGTIASDVEFHLAPCGAVSGKVAEGIASRSVKSLRRVRLRGDWLRGSQFRFVDVPEGIYTLTVEAEGHPEHTETIDVVHGSETGLQLMLPRR